MITLTLKKIYTKIETLSFVPNLELNHGDT